MAEYIRSEYPEDHTIMDVDVLGNERKTHVILAHDESVRQMAETALRKQEEENISEVLKRLKK